MRIWILCNFLTLGKSGASPEKCVDVSIHIYNKCPNLKLSGLMTIGSAGHDYSTGPNPDFELLWKCRTDVCNALEIPMSALDLSFGMSADYEEAVNILYIRNWISLI